MHCPYPQSEYETKKVPTFTVSFYRPSTWGTSLNIYWYNAIPDGSLPSPPWPGVPMTNNGDGWYTYTFSSATAATIIFNDGTNQSVDSYRDKNGWYMNGVWYDVKPSTPDLTWTVNFFRPSTWGTAINIYWYNALPDGALASPSWPGVPMTNNGDGWYSHVFTNIASATVIFNDGTVQSADLARDKTGWYFDGAWYDTKPVTPVPNAAKNSGSKSTKATEEPDSASDILSLSHLALFPNPVKESFFNVFIPGLKNRELATITVLDVNGKIMLKTQVGQSAKVNCNLKSGTYFVRINANAINVTKKLMVE